MDWSNGFAERLRSSVPLAELTWFGLGGSARHMVSPRNVGELSTAVRAVASAGIPCRVLGGGANVLVRDDGFDGLVIRLDEPAFTKVHFDEDGVTAGAGRDLMHLARDCAYRGMSGLECMAGIPGTVGGAITMNAGGRFGEIGDVVERVRLMDRDGRLADLRAEDLGFAYRRSNVRDRIVIEAVLRLTPAPAEEVRARFHEIWALKSASQPLADHCAGCIFKNPPGDSAGRIIDAAGLKGATRGHARVSDRHANFIVADRGATATEVLALVEHVRTTVYDRTGQRLELEIDVW